MACEIPLVREGSAAPSWGLVPMPSAMFCPSEINPPHAKHRPEDQGASGRELDRAW